MWGGSGCFSQSSRKLLSARSASRPFSFVKNKTAKPSRREQQRELEKLQPEEPGTQTSIQPVYDKRLESGVVQLILKNFRAMEDSSLADFKKTLHVKTNQPLPEYFEEIYNQYRGKKATDSTIKKGGYYALTTVVFNEKERLVFAVGVHKVDGSWYIYDYD